MPRLSRSHCQLPTGTVPGTPNPQVLARATLPRTGAPGGHQKPGVSVGMEREQELFLLEQRGVSPLGSSGPERGAGWMACK